MPNKKWFFDTVVISNFLLVDAGHILEKRYNGKGFITRAVYDEIVNGIAAGFFSPVNSISSIV